MFTAWLRRTRPSRTIAGNWILECGPCGRSFRTRKAVPCRVRDWNRGTHYTAESLPKYRNHGAHRRRQDDDDRAHPLLYGHHAPYRRGARGHGDYGLDGTGAGTRHHDYLRRYDLHLEGHAHQHHRHAWPRGLYGRGGTLAARARRRSRLLRRGCRRAAAVRDGVASG